MSKDGGASPPDVTPPKAHPMPADGPGRMEPTLQDERVSYATLVPRRPRIHMSYSGPTVSISIARPINAPAKAIT